MTLPEFRRWAHRNGFGTYTRNGITYAESSSRIEGKWHDNRCFLADRQPKTTNFDEPPTAFTDLERQADELAPPPLWLEIGQRPRVYHTRPGRQKLT